MATLPREVWSEVCKHFEYDRNNLKALRLINQALADEGARYLYKTLLVYQTRYSWKKLHFISQCPHLAKHVEKLQVATLEYLPVYLSLEAWRYCTQGREPFHQVFAGNHPEKDTIMTERDHYERYCYWREGEQELSDLVFQNSGFLSLDAIPFLNLHTVESLGAHELWPTTPECPSDRRMRETAVMKSPLSSCLRMSAHLSLAVRMLDSNLAGISNIVSLELHRIREILVDRNLPRPDLTHLRNLTLRFEYGTERSVEIFEVGSTNDSFKLNPWLRDVETLQTLRVLTQDPGNYFFRIWYDLLELFEDAAWPKLRDIDFKQTLLVPSSLMRFLERHIQSLRSVHIEQPMVHKADWIPLAEKVRALFSTTACIPELIDWDPDSNEFNRHWDSEAWYPISEADDDDE